MGELTVRALAPSDADGGCALVRKHLGGTLYAARMLELLAGALPPDDDATDGASVAVAGDGSLRALAMFGRIAGSQAVRVHALAGGDAAACASLLGDIRRAADRARAQVIVCELPDDECFAAPASALLTNGYALEGSIPDFVRDGIALRLLVWRRMPPRVDATSGTR